MKTIENQGFLPIPNAMGRIPNAMGRSVAVKTQAAFQIINKINGFVHIMGWHCFFAKVLDKVDKI